MSMNLRYVTMAGVFMLLTGPVILYLSLSSSFRVTTSTLGYSVKSAQRGVGKAEDDTVWTYHVSAQQKAPEELVEGDRGLVTLTLFLVDVTRRKGDNAREESVAKKEVLFDNGQPVPLEFYRRKLSWSEFRVKLGSMDMDVYPGESTALSQDGTFTWQVRPRGTDGGMLTTFVDAPHEAQLDHAIPPAPVQVKRRFSRLLSTAAGSCITFLGSLGTLPGILAFLRDQKKESPGRKKKSPRAEES
jgi:hypothetical protein